MKLRKRLIKLVRNQRLRQTKKKNAPPWKKNIYWRRQSKWGATANGKSFPRSLQYVYRKRKLTSFFREATCYLVISPRPTLHSHDDMQSLPIPNIRQCGCLPESYLPLCQAESYEICNKHDRKLASWQTASFGVREKKKLDKHYQATYNKEGRSSQDFDRRKKTVMTRKSSKKVKTHPLGSIRVPSWINLILRLTPVEPVTFQSHQSDLA